MAEIPVPRSYQSTLGDMEDTLLAKLGIQNLRVGAPLLSILETAASSDFRSSQDIFQVLNSISIDTATGLALERIGVSNNVPKIKQSQAIDVVTISDSSFTKIQSKLFQGLPAPIVGTVSLNVTDASLFPNSGNIYIGRGSPNYEGPIPYSAKSNAGTHWVLTLSSPTVKFHLNTESVVLAQGGNRTVGSQTVVQTPQANLSSAITFKTIYSATLPDGETSITGVLVQATTPGTAGNVPANAISQFPTAPFVGATVNNLKPFSNGQDTEKDDDYRERIKNVIKSKTKGTVLAITSAITGITAPDENRRITSTSFIKKTGKPSTVIVDDGTGYEERVTGVAIESLIDDATGGEEYFQVKNRPIAKAFAVTNNSAPYILFEGASLTVKVGGVTYIHNFSASQFNAITSASAYEVTASINGNPNIGFSARTSDAGTKVVLFAKEETNDDIEVIVSDINDSNGSFGFPLGNNFTIQLYKNDRLLVKDGSLATIESESFSSWNAVSGNQTLVLSVDGTPAITYTFIDQDFIDGDTGFVAVGKNTLAAWVIVINNKIPGIVAKVVGNKIFITSNAGTTSKAALAVTGGTLVAAHFFGETSATGTNKDFTLDRSTGQIHLESILQEFDRLSVGTKSARAFLESTEIGNVSLSDTNLWFVVDGDAEVISHGITKASSVAIEVFELHDWGHTLKITAASGTPFSNVVAGDYLVLWDPALDTSLQGSFRVIKATGTYLIIERRLALTLRDGHRSVALAPVGGNISKVLTTGGCVIPTDSPIGTNFAGATDLCEIYNPNTKTTSPSKSMGTARAHHTANLASNGKVVVIGGINPDLEALNTIEIYDPTGDTWTASGVTLTTGTYHHTATTMADGKILIAGGQDSNLNPLVKTYIYDPVADTISIVGNMATGRYGHRAVLLSTNSILAVGGIGAGPTTLSSAELYVPGGGGWVATGAMGAARAFFCLQPIGAGVATSILAVGNTFSDSNTNTYEAYNIAGGTWGGSGTLPSSQLFATNNGIHLQDGDIALLNTYAAPAAAAALTYDGTFHLKVKDPKWSESAVRLNAQYVLLSNIAGSYLNHVVVVGGLERLTNQFQPCASYEEWDGNTFTWNVPDPATTISVVLSNAGVSVVRTDGVIQKVTIPSGTNYTASSLVDAFNDILKGAKATTNRTNFIRINTNTFDTSGDIALVSEDANATGINLDVTSAIDNLSGHIGAVESGNSQIGTPSFDDLHIIGSSELSSVTADSALLIPGQADSSYGLVGLKDWTGGASGEATVGPASNYNRWGSNVGSFSTLTTVLESTDLTLIYPRKAPIEPWTPRDRVFLAAPFSVGPGDDLSVLVDNDLSKRFNVNMFRKLSTIGNTYADTNFFKDADAGNASLAATFGLDYDFNDFAVYMKSRAVAFSGIANKKSLFRYFQYGPEGDGVRVRFSNPDAPISAVNITVNADDQPTTDVRVKLSGGASRNPVVRTRTKLGVTCITQTAGGIGNLIFVLNLPIGQASRITNVTTLVPTLPAGITDHGLVAGDTVYVKSNDVNFTSGLKVVLPSGTGTTIDYTEIAANQGPVLNIGTVSNDTQGEATTSGSGIVGGDFLRVNNFDNTFDTLFSNNTFYITSFADGYVKTTSGEVTGYTPSGVLVWQPIGQVQNFKIFANPGETVSTITTSVNALITGDNYKTPISMALLGSGAGTVVKSTPEELDNATAWYTLSDGINYIQSTIDPLTLLDNYSFKFKNPINGNFATLADWVNEVVYISPITVKNTIDWLNTPTVTGLFSVCDIEASSDGSKVQISSKLPGSTGGVQVQSGLANSVTAAVVGSIRSHTLFPKFSINTINRADAHGMHGNAWCKIENSIPVPRSGIIDPFSQLTSWTAEGVVTLNVAVFSETVIKVDTKLQFEKQGRYIAISDIGLTPSISFISAKAGDYVRIIPAVSPTSFSQVSSANQGIFRVLRVSPINQYGGGTVWIENPIAIEETVECSFAMYSGNSMMPGDSFIVNTPLFGIQNQGVWTVDTVGETTATSNDPFTVNNRFKVSTGLRSPISHGISPALGDDYRLIQIVEGSPAKFIRKINNIVPNQTNGDFMDIRWDSIVDISTISASSGSIITVLDKLDFPNDFASGIDAYSYDNGLIGEANRIIQGDPSDTNTYPGVAAAGAQINISGPLVKRITLALSLRVKSGINNSDIADRVRSAVATVINQTGIGQPVALSKIIAAAEKVVGVIAVSVVSPVFNAGNDLIVVQPAEKPLVLNLNQDITITFQGE